MSCCRTARSTFHHTFNQTLTLTLALNLTFALLHHHDLFTGVVLSYRKNKTPFWMQMEVIHMWDVRDSPSLTLNIITQGRKNGAHIPFS
jgi:hypothetical protein